MSNEVRYVGNELFPAPSEHPIGGEVLTKQADAAETDINSIVNRYINTGYVPLVSGKKPMYGDFSSGLSYHEALDRVNGIEDDFMRLPLAIRERCRNDPGVLLDLMDDPEGLAELEKLGLVEEAKPEAIVAEVEPTPETVG